MSLNYSNGELRALALRWDTDTISGEDRKALWDKMSIKQRRLFKRYVDQVDEKRLHAADSFVKKRELASYMMLFIETKLMPIAANLDEVTRVVEFLALPFYKRWWRTLKVAAQGTWRKTITWLDRRGVRFVQLNGPEAQGDTDGEDGEVLDHAGTRGGSAGPARQADPEVRDGRTEDRVPEPGGHAQGGRGEDPRAGGEGGDGLIRVVRR